MASNYPPGVTGNEPYFLDGDVPCTCGHEREEHERYGGEDEACSLCECEIYDPSEEI